MRSAPDAQTRAATVAWACDKVGRLRAPDTRSDARDAGRCWSSLRRWDDVGVEVELRYVEGCPHMPTLRERLAVALSAAGYDDLRVRLRLIETIDDAALLGFPGSPTVMVDGCDPFADGAGRVGLACRLYRTPDGLAGSPTLQQLIVALESRR